MAAVAFDSSAVTSKGNCRVAALDSTHFVVAWSKGTTNGLGAIVGVLSGGLISFGAAVTLNSTKTYAELDVVALDATHAVLVARQSTDNPDTLLGYVLTISGTGVSAGSPSASALSIGNPNPFVAAMCALDSTHVLLCCGEATSTSTFYSAAVVGTVAGTDVTWGASCQFDGAVKVGSAPLDVVALSSTAAVVCYRFGGTASVTGHARVLTVSGSDVTAGAEKDFVTSGQIVAYISAVALDSARFAVSYFDANGYAIVGNVSGATISFGSRQQFLGNTNLFASRLAKLGTDRLSLVHGDSTPAPDELYFKEASVSGNTISYGASLGTWITGSLLHGNTDTAALPGGTDVIVVYKDPADNKNYADLLSYPAVTTTTAPPDNWTDSEADSVSLADAEAASVQSPQSDSVSLSDGISTASGVEHLDSEADGVTLSDGISAVSGGPHADSEADSVALSEGSTREAGAAKADSVTPTDASARRLGKALSDSVAPTDHCQPGGGPVAEKFAGAGLTAEWIADKWRFAGSGLMAEWVQSRRRIAGVGLMVDFYPYFFNALWGNRFAFTSTCAADVDLAGLGPNKLVACWTEPGDPLASVRVRAGMRSDPFIDVPVPGRVAARPGHVPRLSAIGPSKFAVAYATGSAVSCVVGRVDLQADVEVGEGLALLSTSCSVLDVCDAGKDRFVVCFHRENDSDYLWSVVCSVTGAEGGGGLIPTAGSPVRIATRRVDRVRCAAINSSHVAVMYRDIDDGKGYVRACGVSGLSPSWGAELEFSADWSDGTGDMASLSEVSWDA
jgi:hypothetical protein